MAGGILYFVRDQNMGLVKQCLSALYKKNIQRLTRTFLTLSLADVANRVQLSTPQEAEKYILNMVCETLCYCICLYHNSPVNPLFSILSLFSGMYSGVNATTSYSVILPS